MYNDNTAVCNKGDNSSINNKNDNSPRQQLMPL